MNAANKFKAIITVSLIFLFTVSNAQETKKLYDPTLDG